MKLSINLICTDCNLTKRCPVDTTKQKEASCNACGVLMHTLSDLGCPACRFEKTSHMLPHVGEDEDGQAYADRVYAIRSTASKA